eukprot:6204035-Pleurochrysis_carterae.AAC.1
MEGQGMPSADLVAIHCDVELKQRAETPMGRIGVMGWDNSSKAKTEVKDQEAYGEKQSRQTRRCYWGFQMLIFCWGLGSFYHMDVWQSKWNL